MMSVKIVRQEKGSKKRKIIYRERDETGWDEIKTDDFETRGRKTDPILIDSTTRDKKKEGW